MLNHSDLIKKLDYDPISGIFTRKISIGNTPAGAISTCKNSSKYIRVSVNNKRYLAHRLAWFYVYKVWPIDQIDHIDRNKHNNAISNLRPCNGSTNRMNTEIISSNTSGYKGIRYSKDRKRWCTYIQINKKLLNLGRYSSFEEAYCIREAAEIELFGEYSILT